MAHSLGRSVAFGPFCLYPGARWIEKDGVRVALGSRALDVLIVLVDRPGEVVSHRELTQRVWRGLVVSPGSLRVHINGLRKALGDVEAEPHYIANVPGQGYSFVAPIRRDVGVAPGDSTPGAPMEETPGRRAAATASPTPPVHNLPHQRTSFIGREKELEELTALLSTTRLLTITGSGGCGKSRLAVQLAARVRDDFRDGCWLVELAALDDPTLVLQTVAKTLEVHDEGAEQLPSVLAERLANKRLLLLLDNAEHLVDATAYLVDLLLRCCGDVQILATSREPLNVSGELTYRVPSLSLPEPAAVSPEAVLSCEAGRLFVARARLHRLDFDVTPKNAEAVGSICRRLDGIALALELAAPSLRTMTVQELSRYLDDRFAPLTAAPREAASRHRTLRALIDWSYDQLSTPERIVLRRVAVFAGGWTTEQAEVVCVGDGVDRGDVLGLLTSLTDKSLFISETQEDTTRFRMLETLRQYAWARLRDAGDEANVRSLHLRVFKEMTEALGAEKSEAEQSVKLKQIDRELDNVRAALAWCEADGTRATVGLQMVCGLAVYWMVRGRHTEGRNWMERVMALSPDEALSPIRVRALHVLGALAYQQSEFAVAAAHFRGAIAGYEQLGETPRSALRLNLGSVAYTLGDYAQARRLYEEALEIAAEVGEPRLVARRLRNVGFLAAQLDEVERANQLLEQCLNISRQAGDRTVAHTLQMLGWVRHCQGRDQEAIEMLSEAVKLFRAANEETGRPQALYYLGMVTHDLRDAAVAKAHLREALASHHANGNRHGLAETLDAFGGVMLELAGVADAARIWGHAERLRDDMGTPRTPLNRRRYEQQISETRRQAGEAGFDTAWREGRAMTRDAAVAFALGL